MSRIVLELGSKTSRLKTSLAAVGEVGGGEDKREKAKQWSWAPAWQRWAAEERVRKPRVPDNPASA